MTYEEMMSTFKAVAKSRGFYGELYKYIMSDDKSKSQKRDEIVSKFNDVVDAVLFYESLKQ